VTQESDSTEREANLEGKVLAIASGKGGTGKTISALNLGMSLHQLDKHVLVIDGDLEDPNIGINLGIYSPQVTINEVLEEEKRLLEALYIHETGLRVVPASLSINYLNANVKAIGEVIKDLEGYVLLDCGPGLDEKLVNALNVSDGLICITNPLRSSVSGTIRLIELARDLGVEVEGVIVNNITSQEISLEEVEQITGQPILGEIPYDKNVDRSTVNKLPLVKYKPHSPAATSFKQIAHKIVGEEYQTSLTAKLKSYYYSLRSVFGLD